jgi:hypothetical protein
LEIAHEYGGDLLDFMKKYGKLQKKGCLLSWGKVMEYIGHPVPKNIGFMGIKIRRILRRFQKYELTLVAKEI